MVVVVVAVVAAMTLIKIMDELVAKSSSRCCNYCIALARVVVLVVVVPLLRY